MEKAAVLGYSAVHRSMKHAALKIHTHTTSYSQQQAKIGAQSLFSYRCLWLSSTLFICPLMYCSESDKAKPQVMHQTHSDWFWYLNKHLAGMLHVTPALLESSVASLGARCTCLTCSPCFQWGLHCYACINYFTYAFFSCLFVCWGEEWFKHNTMLFMASEAQNSMHLYEELHRLTSTGFHTDSLK